MHTSRQLNNDYQLLRYSSQLQVLPRCLGTRGSRSHLDDGFGCIAVSTRVDILPFVIDFAHSTLPQIIQQGVCKLGPI